MQGLGQALHIFGGHTGHRDSAVARHEDVVLLRQPVYLPEKTKKDLHLQVTLWCRGRKVLNWLLMVSKVV